ncbi:MAG: hypothetical protein H6Q20_2536 [Bacteroidetes bacterium]|jgi:hypothetical protein|nr:hypothetical protein [Bacteroidota bacterium]
MAGLSKLNINKFFYGFIPGIIISVVFIWIYLTGFYPNDIGIVEILKRIFPGVLFGKILLLAAMPNLIMVFVFYKQDYFKIASGFMSSAMLFVIAAIFML